MGADLQLAYEDPVLYDVQYLDANNGYISASSEDLPHDDGGQTWATAGEHHG